MMADSVGSQARLTADLDRLGPGIDSQVRGEASYSRCRPTRTADEWPLQALLFMGIRPAQETSISY